MWWWIEKVFLLFWLQRDGWSRLDGKDMHGRDELADWHWLAGWLAG